MADYTLRQIDATFWRDVQQRARGDGHTVKAVILTLLRAYLAGQIAVTTTASTVTTRAERRV